MTMNTQGFGEEYWQSFLPMEMYDPSSLGHPTQTAAKPIGQGTERTPGRHGHSSSASATEFPCGWGMSPTQELPGSFEETPSTETARVDPTEWYPHYTACLQHFLSQGQHSLPVQSMAAFINIRLPCQRPSGTSSVSLRPYIRRLIVTAQDTPTVLHAFFGDDWVTGVGCICREERVNYLFTAKSSGWASTKAAYDISPDEHTPTVRPLRESTEEELRAAEARWSEWLAMEDWMVGPRSPW